MSDFEQNPMASENPSSTAEEFGNVPNSSESFGTVPHRSESFRSVPNASAPFGTIPKPAERTPNHTLTVREAARMFEAAGVSRTERSIVNWCLPNKHDVARLDGFFDANERKWFITQESVDRAIAEEQARGVRLHEPIPNPSEETVPTASESQNRRESFYNETEDVEIRARLRDLEIATRVKDAVIQKHEKDLQAADEERKGYIQQLIEKSHLIGSLETQLHQLAAPRTHAEHEHPNPSRRLEIKHGGGEQPTIT